MKLIQLLLYSAFILVLSSCGAIPQEEADIPFSEQIDVPLPREPAPVALEQEGRLLTETVVPETVSQAPLRLETPTPDLRLSPENWRTWPIVPQVSPRAREIYQRGLAQGKNPHAFSKIGDCQSIPASFLGIYDTNRYFFTPQYQYLQETVDYFSGSFNREGESVRGGFNAAAVLLPFWANAAVCKSGENPMVCENRIHSPSIAFISLEVWFEGRTPDVYESYMRRIIEYNIEQGTLPVLATKADNVEGDHSINLTLAKLAYEYDIPLWNFWLAVQPLSNNGLDPADPIGFHLNVDGWNMRSFSALQVLDAIRRDVTTLPIEDVPTPQITLTSVPLVSFQPQVLAQLPYASIRPSTRGASSFVPSILFGFSANDGSKQWPVGVFSAGLDAENLIMYAGDGTILLDVNENGILMAHNANLYVLQGDQTRLLSDEMILHSLQPAIWLTDNRVAAILRNRDAYQIAIIHLDDTSQAFLPAVTDVVPYQLYRSLNPALVYWSATSCNQVECPSGVLFSSWLDGSGFGVIPYHGQPAFASDGKMAFLGYNSEGKNQITLVDAEKERRLQVPGTRLVDAVWAPDSEVLAVHSAWVSDYSGRVLRSWLYFVDQTGTLTGVFFVDDEAIERVVWSPDGQSLLVVRRPTQGRYMFIFSVFSRVQRSENQTLGFTLTSASYALPAPIFWLP